MGCRAPPVEQPLALMGDGIVGRPQIDQHVVAVDHDREAAQLVCPLVERPTRTQVETSVMPVAREDPVADGPAMEREAHVRAPVVDGVYLVVGGKETDRS